MSFSLSKRRVRLATFAVPVAVFVFLVLRQDLRHASYISLRDQEEQGTLATVGRAQRVYTNSAVLYHLRTFEEKTKNRNGGGSGRFLDSSSSGASSSSKALAISPPRPPLEELIDPQFGNITGDVQWLLDFAIVGFGKCGTSTLMEWLDRHEDLQCIQEEVWALSFGRPKGLVGRLYHELPEDTPAKKYKRGYKCPADVADSRVLNYYRSYWPKTKLFVGVRHPISWFQSLYNFRVQNSKDGLMHPNKHIGPCMSGMKNTCTEKGNFAFDLMRLGKQNALEGPNPPMTELETKLLSRYRRGKQVYWKLQYNASDIPPLPNDVFFFDIEQLGDRDPVRSDQFREDVRQYLGLETPLPPITHYKPGRTYNATVQAIKDEQKMNICDKEYEPLREELMRLGRLNSIWIREVFLNLPGVYTGSRRHLEEILEGWMHDPCVNKTRTTTNATAADSNNGSLSVVLGADDAATAEERKLTPDDAEVVEKRSSNNTHNQCFQHNSQAWLDGPRLGNIRDKWMASPDYIRQSIVDLDRMLLAPSQSSSSGSFLMGQTLCPASSRFRNTSDVRTDPMTAQQWQIRLIYLATVYHQHRHAIPEARVQFGINSTESTSTINAAKDCEIGRRSKNLGPYDFECPNAKFLIVPLGGFGIGINVKGGAVRAMVAGLASDRVVLVMNKVPTSSDPSSEIMQPWKLASCDREDYQCFFMPPSPCVLSHADLENAYSMTKKEVRALAHDGMKPIGHEDDKVWIMHMVTRPPQEIPAAAKKTLHRHAHTLIQALPSSANDVDDDPRLPTLNQAAESILEPDGDEEWQFPIILALVVFFMRPNPTYSHNVTAIVDDISKGIDPDHAIGLLIRGTYLDAKMRLYFPVGHVVPTLIL